VSLHGYPLFVKNSSGYFGGAELQISLIVKELIKDKRFKVSLITGDYGQPNVVKMGRLTIYKCFRKKFHRFIELPRAALVAKKISADVYVGRTASNLLWLMALFCRIFNKKLVYMVAHDWDCQKKFFNPLTRVNRQAFYRALKLADLIIAQTQKQKTMLKKNFGLESTLMRSLAQPPKAIKTSKKDVILWVGRADKWKRPLEFIKLARMLPQEKFVMICRKGLDAQLFSQTLRLARSQKNIEFIESVSFEKISQFFSQAKVFVNTSIAEGFPNTFLQSGLAKTPVLSLKVNPDGYSDRFSCGLTAKNDFKLMVKSAHQMLKNEKGLKLMGQNHYNYVAENHSLKNINIFKAAVVKCLKD